MVAPKVVDEIGGRARGDGSAMINNGEAVAEAFGLVHIMRGEQNRSTALLEFADDLPQLPAALRVEPGGGFVEKQNLRIGHQRRGDGQALLLTAG